MGEYGAHRPGHPVNSLRRVRFIERRLGWHLTFFGWIVALFVFTGVVAFSIKYVQPFLALDQPVHSDVLVVEGWVPDYALQQAITRFRRDGYRRMVTTGGPIARGAYLSVYKNYANLAKTILIRMGMPADAVSAVPAPASIRNRTYSSAIALKHWLMARGTVTRSLDVLTLGTHARRSRLLFQEAFGPTVEVGVVSIVNASYDPKVWWRSSAGVRTVIGELIAYIYARFVF